MKVLFVNKFFFPHGGAETVFFQEREMVKNEGYQVIDFSMQHEKNVPSKQAEFFVENVDYHGKHSVFNSLKVAFNFIHNQYACDQIEKLIKQEKPDIVHFHNIYHQITPSVITVANNLGCKTVLTAHDYRSVCPNYGMLAAGKTVDLEKISGRYLSLFKYQWQDGSWPRSFLLSFETLFHRIKKTYESLDAFIAPSEFMKSMLLHQMPSANIHIIPNGIDTSTTEIGEDGGYFLYCGRLIEEKGIETLAKAHQQLGTDTPLKVLGTGPLFEHIEQQYTNVELLGFQTGETLLNLIKNAKAVIVPSEVNENCSMSVLEAMSYGKPVIGANIGGIPEQIIDGETGYLFEAGNADELANKMQLLADDENLVREMGQKSRARLLEKYSLEKHKTDLMDLYTSLLAQ
ncbi:glycosyltransferase family 4 protein [Vibrio sp. CK2-1]|uniref:glycosyltransferase family 4 protein n=1 Tax=Vibrio sp. CK2-1 TaxID=2912249 RepID=UPI001F3EA4ED|nr:glycosyltransferase family 4 protein [Vibrio sp. CK2-1]MCF7353051.1 glycosyltransferase family 4 protein [Vibrio sp. CK2-1]